MSGDASYSSNAYREAAEELVAQVRQHSPAAAECIEQIQLLYGSRAAYLAGFALTLLKQREGEHKFATRLIDLYSFTYCEEMRETAEAMQLYEQAAAHLLSGIDRTDGLVAQ